MTQKTVTCRDKDNNKEEVPVEKLIFRPSVYGVIVENEKVLLVKQWDGYDFPGGGVEKGESVHDALLREVKEETGLSVEAGPLLLFAEDYFHSFIDTTMYFQSLLFFYRCTNPQGSISINGFDVNEKNFMQMAEWVPLEKIDSITFYNPVDSPALIRAAIEGKTML